jgi:hypothetical protein
MDEVLDHIVASRMPVDIAFLILPKGIARSVKIPVEVLVDERV